MGETAETRNDLPVALSEVEKAGKKVLLIGIDNAQKLLELLHGLILHAEVFSVF
jgi:hypothetical protein